MWKPQYYSTLSMADMRHIFRGDNHNIIPNISRRLVIMHNVGKHLLEKYEGMNYHLIIFHMRKKVFFRKRLHTRIYSSFVYSIYAYNSSRTYLPSFLGGGKKSSPKKNLFFFLRKKCILLESLIYLITYALVNHYNIVR